MKTLPVMFRIGKDSGEEYLTAVFPTLCDDYAGRLMVCYSHIGQHSGCCREWLQSTRPARQDEFAPLLEELRQIYTARPAADPDIYGEPVELRVVRRISPAMRAEFRRSHREAVESLRDDPRGAPWSPDARL